jgi:hypothetical protein
VVIHKLKALSLRSRNKTDGFLLPMVGHFMRSLQSSDLSAPSRLVVLLLVTEEACMSTNAIIGELSRVVVAPHHWLCSIAPPPFPCSRGGGRASVSRLPGESASLTIPIQTVANHQRG